MKVKDRLNKYKIVRNILEKEILFEIFEYKNNENLECFEIDLLNEILEKMNVLIYKIENK